MTPAGTLESRQRRFGKEEEFFRPVLGPISARVFRVDIWTKMDLDPIWEKFQGRAVQLTVEVGDGHGVVFFTGTDQSSQGVSTDGTGIVIINRGNTIDATARSS